MFRLRSRSVHVVPPSSETYSAERTFSTKAYTRDGFDGAYTTSTLPHGVLGRPLFDSAVIGAQLRPPSVEWKRPLADGASGPSPPERKVQPLRRKSHMPTRSSSGFEGFSVTDEQPVDGLAPLRASDQVRPPSVVLYRPRSALSLHSFPGMQA